MARSSIQHRVVGSLLDRLLDDDPDASHERSLSEGAIGKKTRDGLKRDLEDLLNTRIPLASLPASCPELAASLVNYGLPDLQSFGVREQRDIERHCCKLIKDCISRFEPRLKNVDVEPTRRAGQDRHRDRQLHFTIHATLVVDAVREALQIRSSVEAESGEIRIEGGGR